MGIVGYEMAQIFILLPFSTQEQSVSEAEQVNGASTASL